VKRSWIVSVAGVLLGVAAMGPANAELRIGVVNATKLMQEAPQAKVVTEALRNEFAGKQRELTAQQATLKAKQEKYEKDGPTMSAEQRQKAEKELRDGNRDYSQKLNDVQEDFNTRQNEELSRLQSAIVAEVQSYALSQKFDLVLTDGVIFANTSLDITAAVLAGLQARAAAAAPAAAPTAPPAKPATPAATTSK
jgi:outer membrane protein